MRNRDVILNHLAESDLGNITFNKESMLSEGPDQVQAEWMAPAGQMPNQLPPDTELGTCVPDIEHQWFQAIHAHQDWESIKSFLSR